MQGLRGQGSLKELLGLDVVASTYARKKRQKPSGDVADAAAEWPSKKATRGSGSKAGNAGQPPKLLPAWLNPKAGLREDKASGRSPAAKGQPDASPSPRRGRSSVIPRHSSSVSAAATGTATPRSSGAAGSDAAGTGACAAPASCPMCCRALPNDAEAINSHIGEMHELSFRQSVMTIEADCHRWAHNLSGWGCCTNHACRHAVMHASGTDNG